MTSVTFVSPYKPIVCGIADYTGFLTREMPAGRYDVLSFNLENYGVTLNNDPISSAESVWYGIPSRYDYCAASILEGLKPGDDQVLWFQHEFGIWGDDARFVNMLRGIDKPKIVTLHTLHFQSDETLFGLRKREYQFLQALFPNVDAITVFTDGIYHAISHAFPKYSHKVFVLRHGTHLYPEITKMSKLEARARINDYLLGESLLNQNNKDTLREQRVFNNTNILLIGGAGFITANKGIDLIYDACDAVRQMIPEKKIAGVYIGFLREVDKSDDIECVARLNARCNQGNNHFLQTYLPDDMLPLFFRALDIHFYWPSDCTQSGIIAHALGCGATIACRDMEGVGETVKMAGGFTSPDFGKLVSGIKQLVLNAEMRDDLSKKAVNYAEAFCWRKQAIQHFKIADHVLSTIYKTKAYNRITISNRVLST